MLPSATNHERGRSGNPIRCRAFARLGSTDTIRSGSRPTDSNGRTAVSTAMSTARSRRRSSIERLRSREGPARDHDGRAALEEAGESRRVRFCADRRHVDDRIGQITSGKARACLCVRRGAERGTLSDAASLLHVAHCQPGSHRVHHDDWWRRNGQIAPGIRGAVVVGSDQEPETALTHPRVPRPPRQHVWQDIGQRLERKHASCRRPTLDRVEHVPESKANHDQGGRLSVGKRVRKQPIRFADWIPPAVEPDPLSRGGLDRQAGQSALDRLEARGGAGHAASRCCSGRRWRRRFNGWGSHCMRGSLHAAAERTIPCAVGCPTGRSVPQPHGGGTVAAPMRKVLNLPMYRPRSSSR